MAMDRSDEFVNACAQVATQLGHTSTLNHWSPSSSVLPPLVERSPYVQTACKLHSHITTILVFIDEHRKDYLIPGRCSESDKDKLEAQVSQLLRTCSQGIEQLRTSLKGVHPGKGSGLNAAHVAHCHGMVLILATLLSSIATTFEQLQGARQAAKPAAVTQSRPQGGPGPPSLQALVLQEKASAAIQSMHRDEEARSQAEGVPGMTQVQTQDQVQGQEGHLTSEQLALVEELAETGEQAQEVERTMHEVAALNRAFASHLMNQNEQIEVLYNQAVEASTNIDKGNVQLKKTTVVNKSAGWGMFWLLVGAGLLLLFFDWRAG